MNFFENMETTRNSTPKQMEAQEAWRKPRNGPKPPLRQSRTPRNTAEACPAGLDMYGDSDAYREYAAKAGQSGSGENILWCIHDEVGN